MCAEVQEPSSEVATEKLHYTPDTPQVCEEEHTHTLPHPATVSYKYTPTRLLCIKDSKLGRLLTSQHKVWLTGYVSPSFSNPLPGSASPLPFLPPSRTPCAPFPGSASPPPSLPPSSSPHPEPVTPAFPPVSAFPLSMENITLLKWEESQGSGLTSNLESLVSAEWMEFGRRVGLPMNRLKGWERQFHEDSRRCWWEVMQHWLNDGGTKHYPDTWEGLYTLVRDCGFPQVATSLHKVLYTQTEVHNYHPHIYHQ